MKETYPETMAAIYEWEGGYTNQKGDKGGPTNWGITIDDARRYWKSNATPADVRAMPKSVAADIYAKHYAAPLSYDDLPAGVDLAVLDYGVNSGIYRAAHVLQGIVGAPQDGTIGEITLKAVLKMDSVMIIENLYKERLSFLRTLRLWSVDGAGWYRRCTEGRKLALDLVKRYGKGTAVATTPSAIPPVISTILDDLKAVDPVAIATELRKFSWLVPVVTAFVPQLSPVFAVLKKLDDIALAQKASTP
jgi:lysozyme family protein